MPEAKVKIYFLGSGPISIPVMHALMEAPNLELVGIGSQQKPDKGTGPVRTKKSPLVCHCEAKGIPVDGIASVNTEEFHGMLRERGVELLVVASFGQILKPALLALPKYGCLNVHASLLPKYRGASPIVAALLNGESVTGVSFMQMEAGLDTGPVYRMCEMAIGSQDNAETLEERLGLLAGECIEEVILDIVRRGLKPVPQPAEGASYARKISKEDGVVRWEKSAREICGMIRAYTPWPCVRTILPTRGGKEKMVKIIDAVEVGEETHAPAGSILKAGKNGITIQCGKGWLCLLRVLPEGRKEMSAGDYLLGSPIPQECIMGG